MLMVMVTVHVMQVEIMIGDLELIEALLRSCTELVVVVVEDIVAVLIVVLVRAGIETSKGRHSSSHRRRRRVRSGCRCCWWERSDLIRPCELPVR
jgi:hypothetical protein